MRNQFNVHELSTKIKTATTADIYAVNKVIKFVKANESQIIPTLDFNSMQRFKGSGSSFNNLPGGGIQGGYIVFIHKEEKNSVPIA